ncbi:MAG TPA: GNAT family N-acetyltransferase [Candidatus Sulfotelmatobacter sp.]|nr:GNAT family N-acetyltransferase [Candidatus Sulfotelmatobacter sp.]
MHALDNVIWQALTTRQSAFAETFDEARRFPREVTSLTAFLEPSLRGYASLAGLVGPGGTATLSLAAPYEPLPGWDVVIAFPGLQMVCESGNGASGARTDSTLAIAELGKQDSPEMVELAALTKPGPFGIRTYELGKFLGMRSEGRLIAMAGERLKVPGYAEVSAVCTHPEHTGRGHARILMMEIMRGIRDRGETPFLHVKQDNVRAVELYERLGFRTRGVVQFTVLRKV